MSMMVGGVCSRQTASQNGTQRNTKTRRNTWARSARAGFMLSKYTSRVEGASTSSSPVNGAGRGARQESRAGLLRPAPTSGPSESPRVRPTAALDRCGQPRGGTGGAASPATRRPDRRRPGPRRWCESCGRAIEAAGGQPRHHQRCASRKHRGDRQGSSARRTGEVAPQVAVL